MQCVPCTLKHVLLSYSHSRIFNAFLISHFKFVKRVACIPIFIKLPKASYFEFEIVEIVICDLNVACEHSSNNNSSLSSKSLRYASLDSNVTQSNANDLI